VLDCGKASCNLRPGRDHRLPGTWVEVDTLQVRLVPNEVRFHFSAWDMAAKYGAFRVFRRQTSTAAADFLDDRPEIPILLLKTPFVFGQEPGEVMEQHPVERRALRMARAIDSRHIGKAYSRSVPEVPEGCIGSWAENWLTTGYTQVGRR